MWFRHGGVVRERFNKNLKTATGEVELHISEMERSKRCIHSPFTIQDDTDGGG